MRIRKGLLVGLICVLIAVIGAFCFAGCNPDKPEDHNPSISLPGDDEPGEENPGEDGPGGEDPDEPDIGTDIGGVQDECTHTYGNWTVKVPATCTSEGQLQRKCSKCNNVETDVIVKLSHKFTTYTSDNNATCTADGTKSAVCDNDGCTAKETVPDAGSKTGHKLTVTSSKAATCVTHGAEVRTCQNDGCSYTETKQIIATGHIWDAAAATCTKGLTCTVKGCTASKPALGHNYTENHVQKTCTEDGKTVHTCSRCNDSYDTDIVHATGHKVNAWSTEDPEYSGYALSTENPCEYQITYHGDCEECNQMQTKTETVVRHELVKVIRNAATCVEEGTILTMCQYCDYDEGETHYSNDGAHSWEDNKCLHCNKTIVTYDAETGVNKQELSNASVAVNNAQLALDEATLAGIEGENVKLTVQPAEEYNPPEGVEVGDVYDFTLGVDGKPVTQFGGYITITLPYNLDENEDPENIGVWYINNDGEPEKIQATYSNGYVTFKTNHFSTYTVTRLTPRQRCDFYGHSYKVTEVPTSCLVTGYKIEVCQRCADTVRTENKVKATGHHIVNDPDRQNVAATCTTDGYIYQVCDNDGCVYKHDQKVPALGHDWKEGTDSVVADCQHSGRSSYTCANCDESYTITTAQLQHNYSTVVHAATCTEGGYTVFTCKYCQYTYNGDYVEAKGHTYVETVVAPTCTASGHTLHTCADCDDSYKTDVVPAAHTWDISAPTCGKGQTCVICGDKGASATGNHTMVNGICSVCKTGCEHTNTVTVHAPSCTEMGYTSRICTKCGREEKSDFVEALGHEGTISCTRCHKQLLGDEFFSNALSSLINKDFAIRVTDASLTVEGTCYKLDFAELFVTYDNNGEIYGYANGTLIGTDTSFPETMKAGITAVITGGYIYVKGNLTSMMGSMGYSTSGMVYHNVIDGTQYIVIPFGKVSFNGASSNPDKIYKLIPVAYDALQTEVIPFLNKLLALGGKDVSSVLGTVAEKFCAIEKSGTGYVLTLDNAAIKTLNDNLYNYTLAENVDILFGEGTFDALKASVLQLAEITVEQIIVTASQKGLTIDEILEIADEISMILCDVPFETLIGFDVESIKDILDNEQLRAMTVLDLVNRYIAMQGADFELTVEIIEEYIDEYAALNVYDYIADMGGIEKAELKEYVDGYFDAIIGGVSAKLNTDVHGNITGGVLAVEETVLDIEGSVIEIKGTLTLTDKVSSNINYAAVADEVKALAENFSLTVPAIKLLYPDAKVETYDNGTVKRISGVEYGEPDVEEWFDGYYYDIDPETGDKIEMPIIRRTTRRNIVEYSYEFGENPVLMISSDCGNWYYVEFSAEYGTRSERQEVIVQTFRGDELVNEETESWDYGSGYGMTAGFYYNIVTERIMKPEGNYFGNEIMHSFVEDETKFVKCGDGCYEWGERHYYCTDCGKTYISYYAHAHKEAFRFEPLTGNTVENCEDGYYMVRYCTECDEEIYRYISYGHYAWDVYTDLIDLSGYDVCGEHYFRVYACACGKEQHFQYNMDVYYMDGGEDALGGKYEIYSCYECGLSLKTEHTYVYNKETCKSSNITVYTVSFNGTPLGTHQEVNEHYSHQTTMFVELADGAESCEDGIIVSFVCAVCGEVEKTYKSYRHERGICKVIDLEEYGAACGEKLYIYGCACGESESSYHLNGEGDHGRLDDYCYNRNTVEEHGYTVYDSLEVSRCAVTDPQCRLTYAVKEYMSADGCFAYRKFMIGYNVEDGSAAYEYTVLIYEHHHHVEGEPVAIDGCHYKIVYTCSRCGDSFESGYTQHTVGDELEHIEGCRYGFKCAVCGEYFNSLYRHDTEWVDTGKNCRWELKCKNCGSIEAVENRHEYEWKQTDGCLWAYTCSGCGGVAGTDYRHSWTVDLEPTCTQFGERHCTECDLHEILSPTDHSWYPDENGLYHCHNCDITNINGVSGDIVLENCSDELGNGENYVVGFWLSYYNKNNQYRYDGEFLLSVTLIIDGGEEEAFADVEVTFASHGGGNYVEFSKAEVDEWAAENGYTSYDVRLSFVPRGWQCDFDYAITFD